MTLFTEHILQQRTASEFFAGIGLVRMGLEAAGWSVTFANDISADKQQMYLGHFKEKPSHFCLEDIHHLDVKKVPSTTLATASFPCTDLSLAGMRNGLSGKQSSAFWGFIRILREMANRRPPLVLLENVTGFLTSHGGKDFRDALLALNSLGYSVDAIVLNAAQFVPQSRVRLFVIGALNYDYSARTVCEPPAFFQNSTRPKNLADFIFLHPEIDWMLRDIPDPPMKANRDLENLVEKISKDSSIWWNEDRTKYLISQMSAQHSEILNAMMNKRRWSYGTVFRRVRKGITRAELRTDGVAGCLRTPKGGSAKQILVQAGYGEVKVRYLTPRECARLMGADDFEMNDIPFNQALFGFGDAVCVPAITWIAENYLNALIEENADRKKQEGGAYTCNLKS